MILPSASYFQSLWNIRLSTFIDADLEETEQKLDLLSGMIRNCIMLNASATVTEREYRQQYEELTRQYEELKAKYEAL